MLAWVSFGPFTFDRNELTLRQSGTVIPLSPKVAEALAVLLADPGALVSKERLRDTLWPDGFVEDGNLTQTIYVLRKTLDPGGDGRAFIETLARRGYRFVAPFTLVEPPEGNRALNPSRKTVRIRLAVAAVVVVAALAASVVTVAQSRTRLYPGLSPESSRAYALGHYYWNKRTLDDTHLSIKYFEDVIRMSPQSALGYSGLAESYLMIANHAMVPGDLKPYYAKAEQYAREALAHDPQSGEALASLGFIAYDRDKDKVRAERELRAAIALRPLHASAHEFLGVILMEKGQVAEANDELKRAADLDPTSPPILAWLGESYYYGRHLEEARRALRSAIDLDKNEEAGGFYLALTDERLGEIDEARWALSKLQRSYDRMPKKDHADANELRGLAALIALRAGDTATANRVMPDLTPSSKRKENVLLLAALCLRTGRRDDALAWLNIGIRDKKMGWMTRSLIPYDPQLAELASDDRFRRLTSPSG